MAINWAKKLQRVERVNENKPEGNDWFTSKEFREKTQYGVTRSHDVIKQLIDKGEIEVYRGSQYNKQQKQLTRKVWYRFIK